MNGFERRKKKKMEDILLAAKELFCVNGVKAVSIAEIAKKAQVSPVSIYNFYDSKDNLVKEVIFSIMDEQIDVYEKLIESELPFEDKFKKMVFMKFDSIEDYSPLILQSPIWTDPLIRNFIESFYQTKTIPLMKKLIAQGKKEGAINSNISTKSILLYVEMFKNLLDQPVLSKEESYDLISLFFFGLLGKPVNI